MHTSLYQWLRALEPQVLEHWSHALVPADADSAPSGYDSALSDDHARFLPVIYAGLVEASTHDIVALDRQLRLLDQRADSASALAETFGLCFRLRRVVRDMLLEQNLPRPESSTVLDELDDVVEMLVTRLTHERLVQADFLAESLAVATEDADRTALQLSALNEVSQQLSSSLDVSQLLDLVGDKLRILLDVEHISIWLNDEQVGLRCAQSWGNESVTGMTIDIQNEPHTEDLIVAALRNVRLDYVPDPVADQQGAWYQPPCGVAVLPLLVKDLATGVIVLQDTDPESLSRRQINLARAITNQAAIALENARLYEQIRRFNTELEELVAERTHELKSERDMLSTLHDIAIEVSSTLDLDSLLTHSIVALARLTNAEHGTVMLIEHDTGHLVTRAALGDQADVGFTRFSPGQGIAGWVAHHKRPALVPDVSKDDRWVTLPNGVASRRRSGALLAVPLIAHNEIMGVITLSNPQVGAFTNDHLRLLAASAGEIAVGVHNANLYNDIVHEMERRADLVNLLRHEAGQNVAILQSLADGVLVCNLDGSVLSVNPAAERIIQRPIETLLTRDMHDILRELAGKRVRELPLTDLLQRPVDSHNQPRVFHSTIVIGPRTVSVSLGPVLTESQESVGALALLHDISREIESDRLKTEFIGTMSHELRTPMTSIKGFTQLLSMGSLGPVNETQRESLQTIYGNAERMITIINDVLDITKLETNSVELDLWPIPLIESITSIVKEFGSLIQSRSHTLRMTVPTDLPLVIADADRLNQILRNLVQNAIKYTDYNGQIEIAAHAVDFDTLPSTLRDQLTIGRRYVQIDIRDTGVGIAPEDQTRIFERFYRANNRLRIEAGGTGLGLSLVRPLVELLGGRIWLTSVIGEGSTFSFVLPAAQ